MPRIKIPVEDLPPPTDCRICNNPRRRSAKGVITCPSCVSASSKMWYKNNKERVLTNIAEYRKNNKDEISLRDKKYRERNHDRIAERKQAYLEEIGPEKAILRSMISRCHNPNDSSYERYGFLGREVDDHFRGPDGYENFIKEVGLRPPGVTEGGIALYTVERKDNTKGYVRGNLEWADRTTQNNNRSNNLETFLYQGKAYTLQELSKATGLTYNVLYHRIVRLGWDIEKACQTK